MPWGRIDDGFYDHPKLDDLGRNRLACIGLYALALSWSNRYLTDGHIPDDRVKRLGGTPVLADALVRAGLWDKLVDGYRIHDFLDYNESADDVRERRRRLHVLGKRGGSASGEARRLKRDGSGVAVELPSSPVRSIPTPARESGCG
jgi:hypothetical protein